VAGEVGEVKEDERVLRLEAPRSFEGAARLLGVAQLLVGEAGREMRPPESGVERHGLLELGERAGQILAAQHRLAEPEARHRARREPAGVVTEELEPLASPLRGELAAELDADRAELRRGQ